MRRVYLALLIVATAALLSAQSSDQASLDEAFGRDVLIVVTGESGCFRFDVHMAVTRQQQLRGLMNVRFLPEWSGMLFVYQREDAHAMWMKNTYIPLDIVFARRDGAVSSVARDTEPLSLSSISSVEPVQYVLELNAGTAARLGIGEGSRLVLERPD